MAEIDKGIHLEIDTAVTLICETSNKSSSSTRNVLYLIVLASVVQFTMFLDTFNGSWNILKYDKIKENNVKEVDSLRCLVLDPKLFYLKCIAKERAGNNSFRHLILLSRQMNLPFAGNLQHCDSFYKQRIESINRMDTASFRSIAMSEIENLNEKGILIERHMNENVRLFRIPIINLSLHVNDTASISGIMLVILFFVLIYTLEREDLNLFIAMRTIDNRYSDNSDEAKFKNMFDENKSDAENMELLAEINRTRRKYHYNYLTMNEVFTRPDISNKQEYISPTSYLGELFFKFKMKILKYKYTIVLISYGITVFNDWMTREKGYQLYNVQRTDIHLMVSLFFFILIAGLVWLCTRKGEKVLYRYNRFQENDYRIDARPAGSSKNIID